MQRAGPTHSREEQWKEIYKILFPGTIPPSPCECLPASTISLLAPMRHESIRVNYIVDYMPINDDASQTDFSDFEEYIRKELPRLFREEAESEARKMLGLDEPLIESIIQSCVDKLSAEYQTRIAIPNSTGHFSASQQNQLSQAPITPYHLGYHGIAREPVPFNMTPPTEPYQYSINPNPIATPPDSGSRNWASSGADLNYSTPSRQSRNTQHGIAYNTCAGATPLDANAPPVFTTQQQDLFPNAHALYTGKSTYDDNITYDSAHYHYPMPIPSVTSTTGLPQEASALPPGNLLAGNSGEDAGSGESQENEFMTAFEPSPYVEGPL